MKQFIARHMKVPDRNLDFVKLDVYFNNELWFRGRANPPAKVRVKARRDGDLVHVSFVETPPHISFLQAKHARRHTKAEKKSVSEAKPEVPAAAASTEQKAEEQKSEEKEKEKAVAEVKMKESEHLAKAQKHATKIEKAQHPQRMALKK